MQRGLSGLPCATPTPNRSLESSPHKAQQDAVSERPASMELQGLRLTPEPGPLPDLGRTRRAPGTETQHGVHAGKRAAVGATRLSAKTRAQRSFTRHELQQGRNAVHAMYQEFPEALRIEALAALELQTERRSSYKAGFIASIRKPQVLGVRRALNNQRANRKVRTLTSVPQRLRDHDAAQHQKTAWHCVGLAHAQLQALDEVLRTLPPEQEPPRRLATPSSIGTVRIDAGLSPQWALATTPTTRAGLEPFRPFGQFGPVEPFEAPPDASSAPLDLASVWDAWDADMKPAATPMAPDVTPGTDRRACADNPTDLPEIGPRDTGLEATMQRILADIEVSESSRSEAAFAEGARLGFELGRGLSHASTRDAQPLWGDSALAGDAFEPRFASPTPNAGSAQGHGPSNAVDAVHGRSERGISKADLEAVLPDLERHYADIDEATQNRAVAELDAAISWAARRDTSLRRKSLKSIRSRPSPDNLLTQLKNQRSSVTTRLVPSGILLAVRQEKPREFMWHWVATHRAQLDAVRTRIAELSAPGSDTAWTL